MPTKSQQKLIDGLQKLVREERSGLLPKASLVEPEIKLRPALSRAIEKFLDERKKYLEICKHFKPPGTY